MQCLTEIKSVFVIQDGYTTYLHAGWILKIFSTVNFTLNYQDKWNWPFLDIFLMKVQGNESTNLVGNMKEVSHMLYTVHQGYIDFFPVKIIAIT